VTQTLPNVTVGVPRPSPEETENRCRC